MPSVKRIVLIRHAISAANRDGLVAGQLPSYLTEEGHAQAARTAVALQQRYEDVGTIARSDLKRVAETSAPFEAVIDAPVVIDPRWREQSAGRLGGLTRPEVDAADPEAAAAWKAGVDVAAADGESLGEVGVRAHAAMDDLIAKAAGPTVLVFTHGGTIRALVARVLGLPANSVRKLAPVGNATISEFKVGSRGPTLRLLGLDSHLHDTQVLARPEAMPSC